MYLVIFQHWANDILYFTARNAKLNVYLLRRAFRNVCVSELAVLGLAVSS